jgi:hydrogenase-4 membrane subunit HyfE
MNTFLLNLSVALLCLSTVGLHVVKKNLNAAVLYGLQSFAVVSLLVLSLLQHVSVELALITTMTLAVKVILAPTFFMRLIKRHQLKFAVSTYANVPATLFAVTLTLLLAASAACAPLTNIVPAYHGYLVLTLFSLFASILLMANRKGVLSQAVGVLSLENSIVAFAIFAGLEQSAILQLGIMFDIMVWMIIAVVMVAMVFRHTGSLDVTNMKNLRD